MFPYPVKWQTIMKEVSKQNKQMHISLKNSEGMHKNRGINYVNKGPILDGHRYAWSRLEGWLNGYKPVPRPKLPPPRPGSREEFIGWLQKTVWDCQKYVLKSVVPVKII